MGADILAKTVRRWSVKHHELGPCLVWTGARGPDAEEGPYGRVYDATIGKTDYVHLVVWRRCNPGREIPESWTVDHLCEIGLCARPDHLDERPVTRGESTRRRHQRKARSADTETVPADSQSAAVQTFAIALFERIDRPQFKNGAVH